MSLFPLRADAGATFGPPGDESSPYRYTLWRRWGPGPAMVVIGCNPSTATATADDPTIRRCIRFARDTGHDGLVMLNLFAWRATDPHALYFVALEDAIGPDSDRVLLEHTAEAGVIVAAWGAIPVASQRGTAVVRLLRRHGRTLHALGVTKDGSPRHPLYLPASARPSVWPAS